jgi:hypothetical protein
VSMTTVSGHLEVVLIGAGIMGATVGAMLKELDPRFRSACSSAWEIAVLKARMTGTMPVRVMPPSAS